MTDVTEIMKAGVSILMDAVLSLMQSDPHQWSDRPCATCKAISDIIGKPFGCYVITATFMKGDKQMTDRIAEIRLGPYRNSRDTMWLCDELEQAQKRIAFLEEAQTAHQDHIDERLKTLERFMSLSLNKSGEDYEADKGYWWCPEHGKSEPLEWEGTRHCARGTLTNNQCGKVLEHRTDNEGFDMEKHRHFLDGYDSTDDMTSTPIRLKEHRTDKPKDCTVTMSREKYLKYVEDRAIADKVRKASKNPRDVLHSDLMTYLLDKDRLLEDKAIAERARAELVISECEDSYWNPLDVVNMLTRIVEGEKE